MERDTENTVILLKRQTSQLFYSPSLLNPHLSFVTPHFFQWHFINSEMNNSGPGIATPVSPDGTVKAFRAQFQCRHVRHGRLFFSAGIDRTRRGRKRSFIYRF
jgi:hypothetical protein